MSKKTKEQNKNAVSCNRVPIVTILGHVDHGKTTILDNIRKANVQGCEAGGITQKVSVFTIATKDDKKITFIDTPGHEAFDLMRSRGGSVADIVLLVVAADDSVKPQTKESIDIINNSSAKPIVVINKCDLPDINTEKVKRDLSNSGMQVEDMGGEVPTIEVSGKTGKGLDELLDLILLVSEVEGLQNRDDLPAGIVGKAFVLESIKDSSKGNVSSLVLTQGHICQGDWFGYKENEELKLEKAKGILAEEGENLCLLDCGCGGKIMGVSNLMELGTEIYVLEKKDEKLLKGLFKKIEKEEELEEEGEITFDDLFFANEVKENEKFLEVIIKSSSEGSLEALKASLEKIEDEEYKVKIISSGVGTITAQDIDMASVSKAIVLGFEVGMEKGVAEAAKKQRILVRSYDIIYKLIEEISDAVSMMATPQETEEEIGNAKVKMIITLTDGSMVLGSRVEEGMMKRDCKVYVVRDDEIVSESKIKSLKINKSSVNEVKKGNECGIVLHSAVDAQEGDDIFCYKVIR